MAGKRIVTGIRNSATGNPPSVTRRSATVTEIVGGELMTAAHGVGVRKAVSAQCMATPPPTDASMPVTKATIRMSNATVWGSKSMEPA